MNKTQLHIHRENKRISQDLVQTRNLCRKLAAYAMATRKWNLGKTADAERIAHNPEALVAEAKKVLP